MTIKRPSALEGALAAAERTTCASMSIHRDCVMSTAAIPLPPASLMQLVGAPNAENFLYVGDQWSQVIAREIMPASRVLDIGCGCGRTARFFLYHPYVIEYIGVDIIPDLVHWCNVHLRPASTRRMLFTLMDIRSETYNPNGAVAAESATFPFDEASFDFLFAASLFTHLEEAGARRYLSEARRCATQNGRFLVSIHIEPATGLQASGNTNRADYDVRYFETMASDAGWILASRIGEIAGQEGLVLIAR